MTTIAVTWILEATRLQVHHVSMPLSPLNPRLLRPFINGQFISSTLPVFRTLINPATSDPLADIQDGSPADVDLAVESARVSMKTTWGNFPGRARRDVLLLLADAMRTHTEDLIRIESLNTGKPYHEARSDVEDSIECFRHFAGHADKLSARSFATEEGQHSYTLREPLGVVGLITSFNYPLLLASWKLAPALAAGNAVVLKPAPQTPLTSLALAKLAATYTNLPPGALNVIPGGMDVGAAIASHVHVDHCSLTGSTAAGRAVMSAAAASNLKTVTLECGGKNPAFVCADADLDSAVEEVFVGAFSNAGQNCCAVSRLYLEKPIHNEFLEKLKARAKKAYIGDPAVSREVNLGPLIDEEHLLQVELAITRALTTTQLPPNVLTGAVFNQCGSFRLGDRGYFVEPTIFTDVPDLHYLAREEIFGPVLAVLSPFTDVAEAVHRANEGAPYGLAAGIFTRDIAKAQYVVRNMRAGMTWINCYNLVPHRLAFGGRGLSGIGKELGNDAIDEFSFNKSVLMKV